MKGMKTSVHPAALSVQSHPMPLSPSFRSFRAALLLAGVLGLAACEGPAIIDGMLELEDTPTAKEAVENLMVSPNPDTRRKAVGFLSEEDFGGEPLYRKVYRQYGLNDKDIGVRAAAARALGDHGGPEDALALVPLLSDKDMSVRLAVADALRRIALPPGEAWDKSRDGLIALLADTDVDVRSMAVDALGHYPCERTFLALVGALEDPSFSVVWYAHRSLVFVAGGHDAGDQPLAWNEWAASVKGKPEPKNAYLWQPYYRRPWDVQWRPKTFGYFYEPPAPEAPRAAAIREKSSLEPVKVDEAQKQEKSRQLNESL